MAVRSITRRATAPGAYPGTANSAPIFVDSDTNELKVVPAGSGTTEVQVATAGVAFGFDDDISLELGSDDDSVIRHRAATNLANTAITDVLIGTPVTQATAANSLIVSNTTASGDILVAANRGGASEEYVFADASAGTLTLTGPGGIINFESGTTQVLGINSATVIEVADNILFTLGNDNDQSFSNNSAGVATDTAVTGALVGTPVTTGVAANSLIIGNVTASGDVLIAANRGGNSEEYFMADSSVGILYLAGLAGGIALGLAPNYPAPDLAGEAVHIWDGTAGAVTATTDSRLIIETNDATANYLQFLSPNAAVQGILFGDVDDADIGAIKYNHSGNTFEFTRSTAVINLPDVNGVTSGIVVGAVIGYTEAAATTYTGTVQLPANTTLQDIQFSSGALWNGTSAALNVGDADDADGWFANIDLKATDLLVGELLSIKNVDTWGAKQGVYLVAATGRTGQAVAAYGATHLTAASEVIGVVTAVTPGTLGRSYMTVTYVAPTVVESTNT